MADYISREAAETLMCDACKYDCTPDRRASGQSLITADECYNLRDLYNIPAADVAEVRHGRLMPWKYKGMGLLPISGYQCSRCGVFTDGIEDTPTAYHLHYCPNYCPNCGAKMDESESAKDTNVPDRNESEEDK